MTKEQKIQLVQELIETFKEYPNFYITDSGGMSVAEMNELRGLCFKSDIKLQMIKNTLIRKALENLDGDYSEVYDALKETSSVFFATAENPSVPAKVLKEFRKKQERPVLKAAVIETSVFKGDDQIKALAELKSKDELIGEIVGLLQSPAKNVVSALKSSGGKIAGILKTLSEKEEAA
ncbi:MAG: 50S ribosomal protein L10 [Bacteroidota bacterium]